MSDFDFRSALEEMIESEKGQYLFDVSLVGFSEEILLKNKEKIPLLYRYSPADYNNIRNLEKETVFLSATGSMNDVFEGLSGAVEEDVLQNIDKLYDLAFIKSFSERKDSLLMWSTYADNYAGMCVEYDMKQLEDDSILYHLFPVRYSNERLIRNNLTITYEELIKIKYAITNGDDYDFDFNKDVMGLFLSKSEEWKYEKEWRLLYSYLQLNIPYSEIETEFDSPNERLLYYKKWDETGKRTIKMPCITHIYLGPKMQSNIKNHIREIGEKLKVPVTELVLNKKEYKLNPKCDSDA